MRPSDPARPILRALALAGWLWGGSALAQTPGGPAAPASPVPGGTEEGDVSGPILTRSNLLGDMGGLRTRLGRYGVSLGLQETAELFGNATGGINQGAAYNGALLMSLGVDTGKAFGWEGGTFNISAWQIHGRNISADNLGVVQTLTGVEATRSTRLWELWFQQSFLDGQLDAKIGQQSLDTEFMTSGYSGLFLNGAMGWPALPANDLYAGGPAFPLSSLGFRVRAQPTGPFTFLAGVFDDNPPGGPFDDDSQVRGASQSGTRFNFNTGALLIAELQYAVNQPSTGEMDRGKPPTGLPGTYKLGGWFDTANFPDRRFDDTGLSLADPLSSGAARYRRHNWSLYGVADQMVWRPAADSPRSIGVFARATGSPGDRNLLDVSVNAGVTLKAPLAGRDDDTVGIGFGLANFSGNAAGVDRDINVFTGSPYPVRSAETFIEVTYQAVIAPWLQIQPDFQYFFLPSGGVPNPNQPGRRIGNEAVFGVRTNIVF